MTISSDDLVQLLRHTKAAAVPSEAARLEITIDTIRKTGITVRMDSPQSTWLREVVDAHHAHLTLEAAQLLRETDLYGVDLDYINACPRFQNGRRQIVVFSGLLQVIRCYAELIRVLNLLQLYRPQATFNVDGVARSEAQAFSNAGFAILADFLITGRPPAAVGDILGPRALTHVKNGCAGAVAFVLAHELGHLQLGHLDDDPGKTERPPLSLALDEEIDLYQNTEFEADRFGYLAFDDEIRDVYMSNVLFFLGPQSFIEAFARPGKSHPFAVNRAAELAKIMTKDSEPAAMVALIIKSQGESFLRLSERRRVAGGDIRYRIHETMPVGLAYRTIREIKERVVCDHGFLETNE